MLEGRAADDEAELPPERAIILFELILAKIDDDVDIRPGVEVQHGKFKRLQRVEVVAIIPDNVGRRVSVAD